MHKAGFVNIIGSPNVGKSTLMNRLVGEKLSIITSKKQTTRHRIMGIVNGDNYQIVYSDTPGVLNPAYKLQERMLKFATSAFSDADIILFVTDVFEDGLAHEDTYERIRKTKIPILVLINKLDLAKPEIIKDKVEYWHKQLPEAEILPISALHGFHTDFVVNKLVELLPEGEPFYDKDTLTDKPMRFFVSEIIREKILTNYKKEIPYACEVVVEEYKNENKIVRIRANIIVERDTQKGIIVGHKGRMIKKVGTEARSDIEDFLGKQVYLDLFVKVDKDWRSKENKVKKYGY